MDKKTGKKEAPPAENRSGAQLAEVVERNIGAILARRRLEEKNKGMQERLADGVTRFAGSIAFVYLHRVLDHRQSRLAALCSALRSLLCHPGHVRLGGGDLSLDLRPD